MRSLDKIKENYLLLLIILFAAFLRFYKSDFQSIWLDEVLSMNEGNPKLSIGEFYDKIMFFEFIPHLYYFLLRISFEIFGFSTLVGRDLSALIGVLGVYAIYLLAKELFNKRAGLIAATVLSVNSFHIAYSQEIRPYGLLFLFSVLSFYRLSIFIKKPTFKNSIYYGFFTGLILNAHFFGFITVFSQYLILLFFLIIFPIKERKMFFMKCIISGVVTLIVFLPALDAFMRVADIDSFWLQKPGPEAYTIMFKDFFGNSEMVLFLINIIFIYYVVTLLKTKIQNYDYKTLINKDIIFSFIIMFVWLFISLIIPLLKSYLDVPMILSRYFINILAVLILTITIGIFYIKNKVVKAVIIFSFLVFSLVDLFVVRNYYNTITKSQYRELTNEIIKLNPENSKVITHWSWIFPYFFENQNKILVEDGNLEDRVSAMRKGNIPLQSFWYADANARPYALNKEDEDFLNKNFYVKENLNYFDAWAKYYVSKTDTGNTATNSLNNKMFKSAVFNQQGHITLFENSNLLSDFFQLSKGSYELIIQGNSQPLKPINGKNAHFKVRLNGRSLGEFYMSENPKKTENILNIDLEKSERVRLQIIYDNDTVVNGIDRNAIITSISLKKK